MIRSKDLNKEIKILELTASEKGSNNEAILAKALLKCGCLVLKVMRDMKTNQTSIMKKMGVEMIKPVVRDGVVKDTVETEKKD